MIDLEKINSYFSLDVQESRESQKFIVKEYILLQILDFLSSSKYVRNLVFIGGTNLRLVKGINRFSEDLDFDCKNFTKIDFDEMSEKVLLFLTRKGYQIENREKDNAKLTAFRSNFYFPQFLFNLKLTGHREERFLIKLEAQNQNIDYETKMQIVRRCGFLFQFPVPPDDILCAMKISALLSRAKGRDFYDTLFLLAQTKPNYHFLEKRMGIKNNSELLEAINNMLQKTNLQQKMKDFEHLLFRNEDAKKLLIFKELVEECLKN